MPGKMDGCEWLRRGAAMKWWPAVAAAMIVLALTGCSGKVAHKIPPPSATVGQHFSHTLPPAVLNAPLTTARGRSVTLASFAGKVVVISDFMSLCQESCPMDTENIVTAARAVEKAGLGNKIEFVSITIDPARDSRAQLAAYRKLYSPAPANWLVLTGSQTVLGPLWRDLGVYIHKTSDTPPLPHNWRTGQPLTYDLTHSDDVFFLDTDSHERFLLVGMPDIPAGASLPATLMKFMDAEGHHNLADPPKSAWTTSQEMTVLSWLVQRRIKN